MNIQVLDDAAAVAYAGAAIVSRAAVVDPALVLGLPTGRTAIGFYAELARRHAQGDLDLSPASAINLDELALPPEHPSSFHSYMQRHAWELIGLARERCEIPRGDAEPEAECERYDRVIENAGGLSVAVLGVGVDGHVAYNLPGIPRERTHVVTLPEALASRLDVPARWRPLRAITLGMGPLRAAGRLLLMATGAGKAPAVRALVEGSEDPRWPCSLLRRHPCFDLLIDRQAARGIEVSLPPADPGEPPGPSR